jgi:hypothetical protein
MERMGEIGSFVCGIQGQGEIEKFGLLNDWTN